jgi:hypothetical protein
MKKIWRLRRHNPTQTPASFVDRWAQSCLGVAVIFLVWISTHYEHCWSHPEHLKVFVQTALRGGMSIQWSDLKTMFDAQGFDGVPRARFISYLFSTLNIKARAWLFEWVPPHPSINLTWVLTLGASPWLLSNTLRQRGYSARERNFFLGLLLSSSGYLSLLILQFHAGKAIGFFSVSAAFWAFSRLESEWSWSKVAWVQALCFLSFFADETAVFTQVIAVFCLYKHLRLRKIRWLIILAPVMFFVIFLKFGYSALSFWATGNRLNYFSFAMADSHLRVSTVVDIFRNWALLVGTQHVPFPMIAGNTLIEVLTGVAALYGVYVVTRNAPFRLRWSAGLLAAAVAFHGLIMSRHNVIVTEIRGTYYYGATFGIFWGIFLITALRNHKWMPLFVSITIFSSMTNSIWISQHIRKFHEPIFVSMFPQTPLSENKRGMTYRNTMEAWHVRSDPRAFDTQVRTFSAQSQWIRTEAQLNNRTHRSMK